MVDDDVMMMFEIDKKYKLDFFSFKACLCITCSNLKRKKREMKCSEQLNELPFLCFMVTETMIWIIMNK